jgi:alkanesulfonate monooxygenase SsuD/methylene tetrahydromethanopterin reductase-like flavin-dependent oxidoreductase (luciferase family)
MEFFLYLPQMRLTFEELVDRARAAEAAGFTGVAGMDHLAPPLAGDQPMFDAMTTATWLAAHTRRLTVGSLVLCDGFRHPAVLAREAVSLDHASGGRFELGIGWGSMTSELRAYGIQTIESADRAERLRETLQVLQALWSGEMVDFDGQFHTLRGVRQMPVPQDHIPIVIGGTGRRTLTMVREFADWWNVHAGVLDQVEALRSEIGRARVSIQEVVGLVPAGGDGQALTTLAQRRFGFTDAALGGGAELVDHFGEIGRRGIERVYAWFVDFAPPETLAAFGEHVIAPLRGDAAAV